MELERRLRKVATYHLALFILPVLSLLYYGWWSAAALEERPDNPLSTSPMSLRGDILDRHGRPLAHSRGNERFYPLGPAAGPLVGYNLRGRNQSGLEALLQDELSPPPPPKSLWRALALDREREKGRAPLKGPSATLPLDGRLQKALFEKFAGRSGAVVVSDSRGDILAAVSAPSFDPNEIARDFQTLRTDPGSPLIERVGGGLYPVRKGDGEPLLTAEQRKDHPWFSENPFPGYPGASAALSLEGEELYSPLMLLQIANPLPPRLISTASLAGDPRQGSFSLPEFQVERTDHGFELCFLKGVAFRESPPFLVMLGRSVSPDQPLAFAVVVEDSQPAVADRLRQELLPILKQGSAEAASRVEGDSSGKPHP